MNETGNTLTFPDFVEIPDSIFRAYDIRGVYGEELSAAVIRRIALKILTAGKQSASELFASLGNRACTPELEVAVAEADKFALMERILSLADFPDAHIILLDGIRVEFENGWGLVRASNTSPALLLRFEADNAQVLESIKARFASLLLQADRSLPINFLNN